MTTRPDPANLAVTIGEFSVDVVGRHNLRGLEVFVDSDENTGSVTVALAHNTDRAQKSALADFADVERAFFDDAILSFSFVRDIDHAPPAVAPNVRHFSYA